MPSTAEQTVADRLAELRPALVARVAEQLAAALPMVGVPAGAAAPAASHHAQMHATAQRFHELVQLSVAADPSLARFEYDWTARVLGPKGVTWEHQQQLIAAYFAAARQLGAWGEGELAELDRLAARLRALGEQVYGQ